MHNIAVDGKGAGRCHAANARGFRGTDVECVQFYWVLTVVYIRVCTCTTTWIQVFSVVDSLSTNSNTTFLELYRVLSPTRKKTSYCDQTLTFASHSDKIQKVVLPTRPSRQQWPLRRKKNGDLSIVLTCICLIARGLPGETWRQTVTRRDVRPSHDVTSDRHANLAHPAARISQYD